MTDPKPKVKRIELQKAMAADVEAALKKAEALADPNDVDAQRRIFRALVTIASDRLFNLNLHPMLVVKQAHEAIVKAYEYRSKKALLMGQPFGPVPTGKA